MTTTDTIFALATGGGPIAVAVLRLSGPASLTALRALCGRAPPPRHASLRRLRDPTGATLDHALVLWMPGPASYTGEDSAEFHVHGGPAVIDGVATALLAQGLRPAEPGEFTRRAFLNGRLQLTEAEAVADLIAAETEAQRTQALRQLDGALGQQFENWAQRVRTLLAEQEARIDFPDETSEIAVEDARIADLVRELENQLGDERRGERLRSGLEIAVTGPPNVGKSSIVNELARRDAVIVAPLPGTTRDIVEVRTVFGGVPVVLLDTAGLRDSEDLVEAEGIRRARARTARADFVLKVCDPATAEPSLEANPAPEAHNVLPVYNKIDIAPPPFGMLGVSVKTGAGLETLRAKLDLHARRLTQRAGPAPLTQARHRDACVQAVAHLKAAATTLHAELRAEEFRLAMRSLGRVTGRVGVEDILDSVFSRFCIGK